MKPLLSRPRLASLAVLSSLATPFFIAQPAAQAAPPAQAKAYGLFKNKKKRNRNATVTLTGVVTRDLEGTNRFAVRFGDGRVANVFSRQTEPVSLSPGDRVELRGNFEGGLFVADSVKILRKDGNNGNGNITVTGVVTRDLAGKDRFTVRLDNGRVTEVISRPTEPVSLSPGDRVELRGDFEKQLFIADSVRILKNVGPGANQQTTIRGRITRDFAGRDFEVLRDNGQTTRARSLRPEPLRLSKGDRVELKGHFEGAIFMTPEVNITRNDDGQNVDFQATVVRRLTAGRLEVRNGSGRIYTVISNASLVRYDRNDVVRIVGFINGNLVSASKIEMIQNR